MNNVLRLPGIACRHHHRGRCLYEERLNPGYHAGFRCVVLESWEAAFEAFVDRAEAFGLDQSDAAGIWRRRMDGLMAGARDCGDYLASDVDDGPGCVHFLGGLCVLRLPACEGLCPRFEPDPGPEEPDGDRRGDNDDGPEPQP
ncbi:MAG: hypothetical protein AB7D57_13270 [Desulfovibrionaceae bacterium]